MVMQTGTVEMEVGVEMEMEMEVEVEVVVDVVGVGDEIKFDDGSGNKWVEPQGDGYAMIY